MSFNIIIRLSFGICMNIFHMKSMNRKWEALKLFSKRGFHLNLVSDSFMPLEFSQSWEKWSKLKHEPYQIQNIDTVLKIKAKKTKKLAFQIYDVCVSRDLRYPPNVSCILKGIQSYVCSKRCKKNIQNFL